MNRKTSFLLVAILGASAVIFGAFGAHYLKEKLAATQLNSYQTGVTYHFYHTLAILGLLSAKGLFGNKLIQADKIFKQSTMLFLIGILCFSGSLYLLSCRDLIGLTSFKWLGPITPIGGVLFVIGWLNLLRINTEQIDDKPLDHNI